LVRTKSALQFALSAKIHIIGAYNIVRGQEANNCQMTYMQPAYIPIPLAGVSAFEEKYRLFRYHEDTVVPPNVSLISDFHIRT
jgi:hypothetical protein